MDRSIIKQYLSGFQSISRPSFFLENSMALGNLPQNISYNGLLYTYNLQENAFINQFGHKIDPSQAPAFITEALGFNQQLASSMMDISSNAGDSRSRAVDENPPPPTDLFVKGDPITPTTANEITWSYGASPTQVDSFVVKYSPTGPKGPYITLTTITNTEVQYYEHVGVSAGDTYYYIVSSIKGVNISDSEPIAYRTAGSTLPPVGISGPSGLSSYVVTSSTVGLSWADNANNEQGFYIYRAIGNSAQPFSIIRGAAANQTTALIQRLTTGTTYSFKIAAYGTGSTSGFSNTITVRTLPGAPVMSGKLNLVSLGTAAIRATWTDTTGEDFYNVQRSTNNITFPFGITLAAGSTSYTFTGLSAGTLYYMRVNAQNAGGTSAFLTASISTDPEVAPEL
jgi:fibronectin type 3 domain-containing protein